MPFEKGRNKTGGRDRGTPNKVTSERKAKVAAILQKIEDDHLDDDLKKLSPRDRTNLYKDLLEYCLPKLTRVEREPTEAEELLMMSSEERQQRMLELREELNKK